MAQLKTVTGGGFHCTQAQAMRRAEEPGDSGSWMWSGRRAIPECLNQNAWLDGMRELLEQFEVLALF